MKLYITRHSKTIWNQEMRLQGWQDSKLTSQGINDALELKKELATIHIDKVYTSPLSRALETTKILFEEYEIDDRIKEMNFGDFEGKEIAKIKNTTEYINLWQHPQDDVKLPNGETYLEVKTRLNDFLDDIYKKHSNESVFITIHGMLYVILMSIILELPTNRIYEINSSIVQGCSLTLVEREKDNYRVIFQGKNDHLSNQQNAITYK